MISCPILHLNKGGLFSLYIAVVPPLFNKYKQNSSERKLNCLGVKPGEEDYTGMFQKGSG